MRNYKLALFLISVFVTSIFSTKSTAQSTKEIFWWAVPAVKEHLEYTEFIKLGTINVLATNSRKEVYESMSSLTSDVVWQKLLEAVQQDEIPTAYNIFSYVQKNNLRPSNVKHYSERFFELASIYADKNQCDGGFVAEELLTYKIAYFVGLSPEKANLMFEVGNICWNDPLGFYGSIIAYGHGLNVNPSPKSYLILASRAGSNFEDPRFVSLIRSASEQVLELPNETITMAYPNTRSDEISAKSHAMAYRYIGDTSRTEGDLETSLQAYKQAIQIEPNMAFSYNGLGKTQLTLNQLDEAKKSLEKAINLKPDYADAYNSLGFVLSKQEKFKDSVDAYRKAVALNPNKQVYHNNLVETENKLALANQIEPKLDTSVRNSVVIVKTKDSIRECGDGTGWIVGNSNNQAWIVTNRHVIQECANVEVVLYDNPSKSLPVEVFKIDEEKDLAILKLSNFPTNIQPLAIASTQPGDNDTVFVIGHPYQGGGESWTTVKGEISAIILGNELLQLDVTADGGNSGSPVLNKSNEVIGLMFELSNDKRLESFATGSFGFAYPISVVQEKLDLWGISYETK